MNEYIGTLFQSRTQSHIFHLQTASYAKHIALNEYYDAIIGLADGIVESYQGKYDIIKGYKMGGVIKDLENEDDVIVYFEQLAKFCELKREKLPQDSYLVNLYDGVDELIRSTLYKLKRLS
tara:strand:- start:143 stop:505 length:363 start_codon:yes stop_codon:yes gene_type:complete